MTSRKSLTQKRNLIHFTYIRWIVLGLSCAANFGFHFASDAIRALEIGLEEELEISDLQFNAFFTIYSIPNMIFPLLAGRLVDRIGAHKSAFLFSGILFTGQFLTVLGAHHRAYSTMLIGRAFLGSGSECLVVALYTVVCLWFTDRELGLANGITASCRRIACALSAVFIPLLYTCLLYTSPSPRDQA
eukprot:TRINITY_DN1850_c0_g1_i1.p2 TRINITY_DN1850_c0_g1~~TRINITY_DN1850_c0_g1_i1.p2  ORF type:complete len:188 (-),score=55.63 TRINITY_DN1850_c0_g1_i1:35-598(-)